MPHSMILRRWTSRIRTADEDAYVRYVEATGLADYRRTDGNLGCQILLRALGDGTTEVTTLSWWASMDAITAFAGRAPDLARYYPEDDGFLLEKPERVDHYRVAAGGLPDGERLRPDGAPGADQGLPRDDTLCGPTGAVQHET